MNVDCSPFLLVDPPDGAADAVRGWLDEITFDWSRVDRWLEGDYEGRILVRWGDTEPGALATYYVDGSILYNRSQWSNENRYCGRVLAHEIGHMVDYCCLSNAQRLAIIELFLASPGHVAGQHDERWKATRATGYWDRIHEAWADVFVQVYAPTLFDFTQYTHRISDLAAVRAIVERTLPMTVTELSGGNRFETAQLVSMRRWPYTHPVEVVIAAEGTPDVQSATAYAASTDPARTLLLVRKGDDAVPEETLEEIERLRFGSAVHAVTFVGGTNVITPAARATIQRVAEGGAR